MQSPVLTERMVLAGQAPIAPTQGDTAAHASPPREREDAVSTAEIENQSDDCDRHPIADDLRAPVAILPHVRCAASSTDLPSGCPDLVL
eukprot:980989-Rhodomonas_salina.1